MIFFLLLLLISKILGDSSSCRGTQNDELDESSAWKHLLPQNYSAQTTPKFDLAHNDSVYIAVQILDIDEVNENQMYYQIQLFLISAWVDKRLNTTHMNGSNLQRQLLPDDAFHCFWSPSLIFDNSKDGKHFMLTIPNKIMTVYHNQTVLMASRFSVKVRCRFDLSRYPMDVQRCMFKMRLFDEPNYLSTLRWMTKDTIMHWITDESVKLTPDLRPTQFNLSSTPGWIKNKTWLNNDYTVAGINITFTRLRTSSILTIYIPSTMIVFLSWISFWIDVQGIPGRVSLGIMSILTIITQILDIRKNMPPVSYVTAIDIWLFACLICVFLSLVEFALAYKYACHKRAVDQKERDIEEGKKSRPGVPNGISRLAFTSLAMKNDLNGPEETKSTKNKVLKRILTTFQLRELDMKFSISRLDDQSKIFFPVLFTMFSLFYWAYYLLSSDREGLPDDVA